mgnify:CR=1 FL=1
MSNTIPEEFFDDDMIYHYTSMETAVNHILGERELKLSKRLNQIDPLENQILWSDYIGNEKPLKEISSLVEDNSREIKEVLNSTYQLSFCRNYKDFEHEKYPGEFKDAGFTRFRMWIQYANNFNGICLAFSKSKLLESILSKYSSKNVSSKAVNYLSIEEIEKKLKLNSSRYTGDEVSDFINDFKFMKYKDFRDEAEFRIIINVDSPKESLYFNYGDSLKGIFFHYNETHKPKTKELHYDYIKAYCNKVSIEFKGLFFYNGSLMIKEGLT